MRRLRMVASGLVAGLFVVLSSGAMAYAAPVGSADLQVTASQASGQIGGSVQVRLVVRNNGPAQVLPETWQLDFQAPPGTQIAAGSALSGACSRSATEGRCRYGFGLRRGERRELQLGLLIQAQPSGCGRATVSYLSDNRIRNNAVNIRVSVGGQPNNCFSRTSPTPRASLSAAPTATPDDEVTGAPPQDLPASVDTGALPAYPTGNDKGSGGLSLGSMVVIGGGLALVVVGGLLIWRLMRRDPEGGVSDETAYQYPTFGGPPSDPYQGGYQQGGYQQGGYPGGYQQGGRPGPGDETGPIYG
jgi:hypothetical protein